jgi:tetratricopeptide (TPR) repeat protein
MTMTVSTSFSLALLLSTLWLPAHATQVQQRTDPATRSGAAQPRPKSAEDELARHLSAAETYQLSGDLARAAVENRAVAAVALARLGAIAIREGQFQGAVRLLADSLALRDDAVARVDLAIAHMRLMEVDRAAQEARAALKLDERDARAHHVLGKLLYMKGDYAAALSELERAVVLDPDPDAAYTLGMTYLRLKQLDRAKLLFEEMQAALNNSAVAHILFGRAYHETGFVADAEREFRRALSIDARAPRAHFYLGYVIMQHGGSERLAEAGAEFERELQLHPQDFYANFFLGVLASTVESDHKKAMRYLQEAARLKPDIGETYLYLGQSQAELGDASAEKSLRRAIELSTDASNNGFEVKKAHFLLGRVLLKAGRRAEAEKELAVARELQGQSLETTRQQVSEILGGVMSSKNSAAAADTVAAAADANGRDAGNDSEGSGGGDVLLINESAPEAGEAAKYQKIKSRLSEVLAQGFHNLGVIAVQQGDPGAGLEQFASAAQWKPDLDGLDRNWGIAAFRAGQFGRAVAPLSRQLKAHPEDALARRMLGVSFYLTGNFQGASDTLKPFEATITSDPELAYAYGVSLVRLAENQRAALLFARLGEQHPKTAAVRFLAAQGFVMTGDYERAVREFRGVAELDPRMPLVHYNAGQSLIRLNRAEEAEREFRQELLLNPSDEKSKYHLAYVLLERKQQTAEALTLLREAVAIRPDYADARYQLGKTLIEQGDAQAAVAHLESAARIDPAKDYIHYQLSIAYRRTARAADAERELQLYRELKASSRSREQPTGTTGATPNVP